MSCSGLPGLTAAKSQRLSTAGALSATTLERLRAVLMAIMPLNPPSSVTRLRGSPAKRLAVSGETWG
ncbi:hypothetical protein [Erwinia amylovora]|uniref:hypothetical protein n=1 Tax=Erwinia amylovora TaxID=552 RepID=UPI00032006A5|nr:hypothetical protein [Erwinia amylovora]MCK8158812.1 hypothetical protein [Erwinia amylovora]MCK8195856.1 hypothetical protein [Erwinia amylovora]MCK8202498.1 hypothetical protein [Erwinia amylovora]MCK8236165.1 hypothetical protein [Erwinia amylovora]MCK8256444.1 hypothetical protein [Erwinia amylovora]